MAWTKRHTCPECYSVTTFPGVYLTSQEMLIFKIFHARKLPIKSVVGLNRLITHKSGKAMSVAATRTHLSTLRFKLKKTVFRLSHQPYVLTSIEVRGNANDKTLPSAGSSRSA